MMRIPKLGFITERKSTTTAGRRVVEESTNEIVAWGELWRVVASAPYMERTRRFQHVFIDPTQPYSSRPWRGVTV